MKYFFYLLSWFALATCCLITNNASASSIHWISKNTAQLDSITISRPNDRWRVVNAFSKGLSENLVDFKFNQHGEDTIIRIRKKSGLAREFTLKNIQKNPQSKKQKIRLQKNILAQEFTKNFSFDTFLIHDLSISAHGISRTLDHEIFLKFILNPKDIHADMILIEMQVATNKVKKFKSDFEFVVSKIAF